MRNDFFIWGLMARVLYGEASEQEQQALQNHLASDPELQQQYELLHQLLKNANSREQATQEDYTAQAGLLLKKAEAMTALQTGNAKNRRSRVIYYSATAAAVAMLAYWGITRMYMPARERGQQTTYHLAQAAPRGERKQVQLPDGTRVWLNGGSDLFYVTDFKGTTREVKLEGEAFFDVVKMPEHPFIVHAGNIDIKVLGTAFNVKAYSNETVTTAALYRGVISIIKHDGAKNFQPVLLYPNQKLVIPNVLVTENDRAGSGSLQEALKIEPMDSTKAEAARAETAWMYNRLEFRGDDFVTLAHKTEQWYNVSVHFTDDRVKNLSFNGSFEKETIAQALEALKLANPFNYKIANNEIFISSAR